MPFQANREHKCDPQAQDIRGLSLLRDHLEEELGKMRNDRDEARQWARKLYRKLDDQYEISQQDYKENSQLRGQLNKMKATWLEGLDLWRRMRTTTEQQRDRADAENETLRAQLAEARNKALDRITGRTVTGALKSAIDAHGPIDKTIITSAAKRILGALNNTAAAYPADEISTDEDAS